MRSTHAEGGCKHLRFNGLRRRPAGAGEGFGEDWWHDILITRDPQRGECPPVGTGVTYETMPRRILFEKFLGFDRLVLRSVSAIPNRTGCPSRADPGDVGAEIICLKTPPAPMIHPAWTVGPGLPEAASVSSLVVAVHSDHQPWAAISGLRRTPSPL